MKQTRGRRVTVYLLAAAMILSLAAPSQTTAVNAAGKGTIKTVSATKKVSVSKGGTKKVAVKIKYKKKGSVKVSVSSSKKSVATGSYKSGKVTIKGKKTGKATLTVKVKGKNTKTAKITVKVTAAKTTASQPTTTQASAATTAISTTQQPTSTTTTTSTIDVTSVTLSKSSLSLMKGETDTLVATVLPENAADKGIVWSSEDEAIAKVSTSGVVSGINAGITTITAKNTASGRFAKCVVTVKENVTVTSKEALTQALENIATIGQITLDMSNMASGDAVTIPTGNYADVTLVVSGNASAQLVNNANFKTVALAGGNYTEKGNNELLVSAPANITIDSVGQAKITILAEGSTKSDVVTIKNNGTLSGLDIMSPVTVRVSGSPASTEAIPTNINSKDVKVVSSQNMEIAATEKAELVFTGDTDNTSVKVDTAANTPDISGVGNIEVTCTDTNESTVIAATENEEEMGKVAVEGVVRDAYTNELLENVTVVFVKPAVYLASGEVAIIEACSADATGNAAGDTTEDVTDDATEDVTDDTTDDATEDVTDDETSDTNIVKSSAADSATGDATIFTAKLTTDKLGHYETPEIIAGNYYIVMIKDGYKPAIQLLAAASSGEQSLENEIMYLLDSSTEDDGTATIQGTIQDAAQDATAGAGMLVELRRNKGNVLGDPIASVTTDEDGTYSFGGSDLKLYADQYTIRVVDKKENVDERYATTTENICLKAKESKTQNVTVSKAIKGEGVRFVLTWGSSSDGENIPEDLDSHIFGPRLTGTGLHEVYYGSKSYGMANTVYTSLDRDETEYSGPETVTINVPIDGVYYYYVYDFSGTGNLKDSLAKVKVLSEDTAVVTYEVANATGDSGNWWKVCSYDTKTKRFTRYNVIESVPSIPGLEDIEYADGEGINSCKHGNESLFITDVTSSLENGLTSSNINDPTEEDYNGEIYLYGTSSWDVIKDTLTYQTASGYTVSYEDASDTDGYSFRGVVTVKSGSTEVAKYDVYYYESTYDD